MNRVPQTAGTIPPTSTEEVAPTTAPAAATDAPRASSPPAVSLPISSTAPSTERAAAPQAQIELGLNGGDRRVVAALIVIALLLLLVHWYRLLHHRPAPIEVLHPEDYVFQLDVNAATWVEWMQLDRVGETLARRIVEDRRQYGPFASVEDLQRVPGIGPKTMESLRPHLMCSPPPDEPDNARNANGRSPETHHVPGR